MAVSNVDTNTDFALVDVCTEAIYCSMPVVVLVTVPDEVNSVNRQWATTLCAIEGYEPTLTAAVTFFQVEVSLEYYAESGSTFLLVENAIL